MQLGVRAHDFGKLPLPELARRIAAEGLSCVQFAPTKALAGFDDDAGRLSPGSAVDCRETLARFGISIAVLGCYINFADPDEERRAFHLRRFKDYLRHARDFGCALVGTETGSLNGDFSWHPENHGEAAYQRVLAGMRELAGVAESSGAFIAVEAVERYVIDSPARLRRLLDDVGSPNLQIIFDPVNLLNAKNHSSQATLIDETFDLLGDHLAILHAKDFIVTGGEFQSVSAGTPGGMLDYDRVLRGIRQRKPGIQILLEDTAPATIAQSIAFVRAKLDAG